MCEIDEFDEFCAFSPSNSESSCSQKGKERPFAVATLAPTATFSTQTGKIGAL
jgi:hypothetical protein